MAGRAKKKATKTARKKTAVKKRSSRKSPAKKRSAKKRPAKKAAPRRKIIKKKIAESTISNQESQWKIYKNLQQRIDKAWEQLQEDVERNAPEHILLRNKNHLLLLLGECNYMARECVKSAENEESAPSPFKPDASGSPFGQK